MRRLTLIALCCLSSAAVADIDPVTSAAMKANLPVLPVSAINTANREAKAESELAGRLGAAATSFPQPDVSDTKATSRILTVKPGMNEIIPMSVGHTNRFVMPFSSPQIRTTSNASFDVDGRVVYVTSSDEGRPVTVFVTEKGDSEFALSLTFVPKRMPPVEVTLKLDSEYAAHSYRPNAKAQKWETSHPYLTTLREVLRSVALGEMPQGYTVQNNPSMEGFSGCNQPGLHFDFASGQSVDGHQLRVNVGVVTNTSDQTIEFREPSCADFNVKAVTSWPYSLLEPGQRSEVYVVRGIEVPGRAPAHNARRSLLEN